MATVAERMDTAEDRLDRLERLAELHGAFVTRFEEKVDRYIEQAAREREEDRREAARLREEDRQEAAHYWEESDRRREEDRQEAARYREESDRLREEDRQEAARYREEAERRREEDRQEAARYWEESDRRREEDRQEAARYWKESDRRREEDRQEAARYWEESDRRHEEDRQEAARYREKVDRYIEQAAKDREEDRRKAARYWKESDRERREMNKRWGHLANKMGTMVEDLVGPSVRRMASEIFDCGDEVFFACRLVRTRSDDRSRRREFDGLYVGTRGVVLNETSSAPDSRDVRDFVRFFKSGEFFLYFPEYRDLPVIPVFSSLNLPGNLVTMLTRNGIHALAMGGETMQLLNLDGVRGRRAPDGSAP